MSNVYQRAASLMAKEGGFSQAKIGDLRSGIKELKNQHVEARKVGEVSILQELFEAAELRAIKKLKLEE